MAKRIAQRDIPERVALEHAVRRWESESQNAERLAHRENGLLTILSAVLGFGLFKLTDIARLEPHFMAWVLRVLLVITVGLVLVSFFYIFLIPRRRPDPESKPETIHVYASGHLAWPTDPELQPARLQRDRDAIRIAFALTARAATSLHRRNVFRRASVDRGQRFLVLAIVVTAVAIVCYMFCSVEAEPKIAGIPIPATMKECPR